MAGFNIDKRAIEKMQREIAKEFERAARKHPVRVPVEVGSPKLAVRPSTDATTEKDPHLSRLLIWLDDLATLRPGRSAEVSTFVDAEGLPPTEAKSMALQLEQQGLVRIQSDLGGTGSIVSLTDSGALGARRLRALRSDSVARFVHACDSLLHWMFQTGRGRNQIEVMAFVEAPGSHFAGDSLTIDEILGALEHLAQRKLVRRVITEPTTTASIRAEITEAGTDCVLSGGSVSGYLSRRQSGRDIYNFTNSSGIVAGSHNVTQNNSFNLDTSALTEFARLVRQFAPALDASEEEQDALINEAGVLEEVTAAGQPEPGRVRAAYQRVQEALAGLTTTTAGLTLLVQKGHEAYSAVFGG